MGVLSKRDEARLAELDHLLADLDRTCDEGDVLAHVSALTGVEVTASLRFEYDGGRMLVAHADSAGPHCVPKRELERLKRGVSRGDMQFLFSSPVPERAQRNRVNVFSSIRDGCRLRAVEPTKLGLTKDALATLLPRVHAMMTFYDDVGVLDMHSARILVCDGPLLLKYVSIVSGRPFSWRQRALFVRASRALQRRSILDHRLRVHTAYRAALGVALEEFGRAAFLLDRRGTVVHANQLGELMLDRERALPEELAAAVRGARGQFEVHAVAERGLPPSFLVVRRHADLSEVAAAFATEKGFTGRAREVCIAATTGEPTKYIAARLGIAENTVEYYLTRIFRALGIRSRAELQRALTERLLARSAPTSH